MSIALLFYIINIAFSIYTYMIIGYILISWIPSLQQSAIGQFLATLVEPYLSIFRKIIPPIGMIDLSPIIAIIALNFASFGIKQVLLWIF